VFGVVLKKGKSLAKTPGQDEDNGGGVPNQFVDHFNSVWLKEKKKKNGDLLSSRGRRGAESSFRRMGHESLHYPKPRKASWYP